MAYLNSHGLSTLWTKIGNTFIKDANTDNKVYGRKNGAWVEVQPAGDYVKATVSGTKLVIKK